MGPRSAFTNQKERSKVIWIIYLRMRLSQTKQSDCHYTMEVPGECSSGGPGGASREQLGPWHQGSMTTGCLSLDRKETYPPLDTIRLTFTLYETRIPSTSLSIPGLRLSGEEKRRRVKAGVGAAWMGKSQRPRQRKRGCFLLHSGGGQVGVLMLELAIQCQATLLPVFV